MYEIKEIDDATFAFPANIEGLIPTMSDIPDEFHRSWNPYNAFVTRWFFQGLENPVFIPKEGVDTDKALRHIGAVLRSFQPKHEHKTAGCAFLLAEWFDSVTADNIKDIKFQ